jgi:hypothetical protein
MAEFQCKHKATIYNNFTSWQKAHLTPKQVERSLNVQHNVTKFFK